MTIECSSSGFLVLPWLFLMRQRMAKRFASDVSSADSLRSSGYSSTQLMQQWHLLRPSYRIFARHTAPMLGGGVVVSDLSVDGLRCPGAVSGEPPREAEPSCLLQSQPLAKRVLRSVDW